MAVDADGAPKKMGHSVVRSMGSRYDIFGVYGVQGRHTDQRILSSTVARVMDLSRFLRQTVKTQNPSNGE
jgi:hypothetical protein